jgi:hypothetical protein
MIAFARRPKDDSLCYFDAGDSAGSAPPVLQIYFLREFFYEQ